jgi:hypothetical protein
MALATHFVYGPTLNDIVRYGGVSPTAFEFTGVTSGDAGWARDSSLAGWQVTMAAAESIPPDPTGSIIWDCFYYHTPRSLTSGNAKAVQRLYFDVLEDVFSVTHFADIQFYNDAGTCKFRLARDQSTQKAISTTGRSLDTTYLVWTRRDTSTDVVTVFINGASDVTFDYTDGTMLGWPIAANRIFRSGPSDEAVDAWWSSIGGRWDTSDTEDETQYPECHQHLPTANGNYTAYKSSATGTTPGDWQMWDDPAAQDGDATYNQCVPSSKQSSQVAGRTYTNTIVGLSWWGYLRNVLSNKNAAHWALLRQSSTDKERGLPVSNSTSYASYSAVFNTPPAGTWEDALETPVLEAGHSSGAVAGALINVTAILCEGLALGATNKAPPDPPAAAAGRRRASSQVI